MKHIDLERSTEVDLSKVELDFEQFRKLSRNPNLSPNERIGFPDSYRQGYDEAIFADIEAKLPTLLRDGARVLDIGPGCAELPRMLISASERRQQKLVLVDSREMLGQLPDSPSVSKIEGCFPKNFDAVQGSEGGLFDAILCYSVIHYMYLDSNLFDVIDGIMTLLAPGGCALIGDIPNVSKRRRFFSSASGIAYHKSFMNTDDPPKVDFFTVERGRIDDSVLSGLVQRCQQAGFDAYIVPQPPSLPMHNRRDDMIIRRP